MSAAPGKRMTAPVKGTPIEAGGRAMSAAVRGSRLARLRASVVERSLPRLLWSASRTGRAGLAGLALIGTSAMLFLSTVRPAIEEVAQMRSDIAATPVRSEAPARPAAARGAHRALASIPPRTEIPALLRTLLAEADGAHLTLDSARYQVGTTKAGALVRYQISFPVEGAYTQVRAFIDTALAAMPVLAIDELSITRKTIADPNVEAQIRMTLFTRSAP